MSRRQAVLLLGVLALAGCGGDVGSADVRVAVAANFARSCEVLAAEFEARTDWSVQVSSASTGVHCAQILQGAPYDVFLAADVERPDRLEQAGLAVPGSAFVYALGRLALVVRDGRGCDERVLREGGFVRFAVADPELAPYGAASIQVLDRVGPERPVVVRAKNVLGALHFVRSGGADGGLVALSSVVRDAAPHWPIPVAWHQPIRQGAVLLRSAKNAPAARAFLEFLASPEAATILRDYGYAVPSG